MGPKLLKRISKLLQNQKSNNKSRETSALGDREGSSPQNKAAESAGVRRKPWTENKYNWHVDDDEDIPGTVRIVLKTLPPVGGRHLVRFDHVERCFLSAVPPTRGSTLFEQEPSTVSIIDTPASATGALQAEPAKLALPDYHNVPGQREDNAAGTSRPASRLTEDEGDGEEGKLTPRNGGATVSHLRCKGINQFSYCDRAAQTIVLTLRDRAEETINPQRLSFSGSCSQWEIYDWYVADVKQKEAQTQMQQAAVQQAGSGSVTSQGQKDPPGEAAMLATAMPAGFVLPLSLPALTRLTASSKMVERMLNQNSYDDIAQDFRYWEDAADEFREPEGSLLPLWRLTPPPSLLRPWIPNGGGPSTTRLAAPAVAQLAWHPKLAHVCAIAFHSRSDMEGEAGLVCVFSLQNPGYPEWWERCTTGVSSIDWHPGFLEPSHGQTAPTHQNAANCAHLLALGLEDGHVAVWHLKSHSTSSKAATTASSTLVRSSAINGKSTRKVAQVLWNRESSDSQLWFYSVSGDGCLTCWSLMQGTLQPFKLAQLFIPNPITDGWGFGTHSGQLAACCTCLAVQDIAAFIGSNYGQPQGTVLVGTAEGLVFWYTPEGDLVSPPLEAHQGPVYTVQWSPFHPHIFLTCGQDWTLKIWSTQQKTPLLELEVGAAAEAAAWSPTSSTVVATVTADARLLVYDFHSRRFAPVCTMRLAPRQTSGRSRLTAMAFSRHHPVLLVGDDRGHALTLKLSPNLRKSPRLPESVRPQDYEASKLERLLILMKDPGPAA